MSAGYSKTPLIKKLGYKPFNRILIQGQPQYYWDLIGPLPEGVQVLKRLAKSLDLIHFFTADHQELAAKLPKFMEKLEPNGMIWVSWPKKASKMPSTVTEDVIRKVALPMGLVDVKVCAVDEVWSGLKLVIRKELR